MKLTTKVSCICGSEIKLDEQMKARANVYVTCVQHGARPVDREGVRADVGVVRFIRGGSPAAVPKVDRSPVQEDD